MRELIENSQQAERAVLVCVDCGEYDPESSLDELEELTKTAGAEVVARLTQKRDKPDNATYIGSGKLEELKEFCKDNEIALLIFDGDETIHIDIPPIISIYDWMVTGPEQLLMFRACFSPA